MTNQHKTPTPPSIDEAQLNNTEKARILVEKMRAVFMADEYCEEFFEKMHVERLGRLGISIPPPPDPLKCSIVLLGAGEVGKSYVLSHSIAGHATDDSHFPHRTFFQQCSIETKQYQYSEEAVQHCKSAIYYNVLCALSVVGDSMKKDSIPLSDPSVNGPFVDELIALVETNNSLVITASGVYTEQMHNNIVKLLDDDNFRRTLCDLMYNTKPRQPSDPWSFPDGISRFLTRNNIHRLRPTRFKPNQDDIVHMYRKTTGIVEYKFKQNDRIYQIIDTGGQRSERKKWKSVIVSSSLVVFVCSLSDFTKRLYEDDSTNRLLESISLFDDIAKITKESHIALILNKEDILRRLVHQEPAFPEIVRSLFTQMFPVIVSDDASDMPSLDFLDKEDDLEVEDFIDFISKIFRQRFLKVRNDSENLHTFVMTATDRSSVVNVLNALVDIDQKMMEAFAEPHEEAL